MPIRKRLAWDEPSLSDHGYRKPTNFLPVGYPFVTCRPVCPGCSSCAPGTEGACSPGTLFYPTTCLPSTTCLPTVPPGCVPRPCTPV